jgi:hypothetical protein
MNAIKSLLSRIGHWLNARLNIVANDEDSERYSRVDDDLRSKGL